MSRTQNNFIFVALVAIIIIGVVISLELTSILDRFQQPTSDDTNNINEQLVELLVQERVANAEGNNNQGGEAELATGADQSVADIEATPIPPTPVPAATYTATPEPHVDYVFTYLPERTECVTATEIVAHLMESWGYHIRLDVAPTLDDMYLHLTTSVAPELQAHMTFCYVDPDDRNYFRIHLDELAVIGDGYYADEEMELYTVSHTGFIAELEEKDHCIYNFLNAFNKNPIPLKGITPTDFLFDHHNHVDEWGDCFGHKKEQNPHG
ncbi:MAG: hypothetical protein AAF702_13700 [Chloroflexota bacterium]